MRAEHARDAGVGGPIPDFSGGFCVGSVAFSRVVSQPGLGVFDSVVAVADLDADGATTSSRPSTWSTTQRASTA